MSITDGASILLVEDELLLRMVMADELRDAGYQVTDVANAEEAIAALPQGFAVSQVVNLLQADGPVAANQNM
jgi:CheY-like chemotaxis protein